MKKYQLFTRSLPPLGTNCYLLIDNSTNKAIVVDPASRAEQIFAEAEQKGAEITAILLTHGHWDHVGGAAALAALCNCPVYLHAGDLFMLPEYAPDLDRSLVRTYKEGDVLFCGELPITVLETPGHTPGGVCLYTEDLLFSGDTLFRLSCGRTDLPGGDWGQMEHSLKRLAALERDYTVLPGHEESTQLSFERQHNPFMVQE